MLNSTGVDLLLSTTALQARTAKVFRQARGRTGRGTPVVVRGRRLRLFGWRGHAALAGVCPVTGMASWVISGRRPRASANTDPIRVRPPRAKLMIAAM